MENGERVRVLCLFAIVLFASASGNLSQTAVNAMLPGIMGEFSIGVEQGQWLTTGYMLVLGITVPVATYFSRRFSTRQHVLVGICLFLAGSVVALLSVDFLSLLIGRVLQAVSTGLLLPMMQTIAMTRFPADRRATAMGVAGIAMGFAPNIGPTVGGAFASAWGWRSFFLLLLVIAAVLLAAAFVLVQRGDSHPQERFDIRSFAYSALGFGGLLLGFSQASSFSWGSPAVWAPIAVGCACLALFAWRQKRIEDPLIHLEIFSSRTYDAGLIALCLLHASFMGVTLVIPLFVEGLLGGTALEAGVVLLPGTVAALVLNPLAGVLTDRIGIRPVVLVSAALVATGSVLMVLANEQTSLMQLTLCQAVRACGVSGLIGPLIAWSLGGLPRPIVTDGSAFSIAGRQASSSLGTSLMVVCISWGAASGMGGAFPYQVAFGLSAVFAVVLLAFVVVKVRDRAV